MSFGIDQVLIADPATGRPPGRMALATAISFTSLGLGLLCTEADRNRARDTFAICALAIMGFSLYGYLFGAAPMYRIATFGSVALHTALGLILGSVALLAARPEAGLPALFISGNLAGLVLRRVLPVLATIPLLIGILRLRGQIAGYYDTRFGLAISTFSNTALLLSGGFLFGAYLDRSERRRTQVERDRAFLLELSPLLIGERHWEDLAYELSRCLAEYLGLSRCMFGEVLDGERLRIHRDYHSPGEAPLCGDIALSQFSLETQAEYHAGRTVIVSDAREDPRTRAAYPRGYAPLGMRALVNVPLMHDGRWTATLAAIRSDAWVWQEREVELIRLVGERAWSWLERLRAIEAEREVEAQNRRLIADLSSAKRDLEQRVMERTTDLSKLLIERDALHEASERAAEQFRLAVETNPAGMLIVDRTGRIVRANAEAQELFGYARDELEGASIELLLPERYRRRHASHRNAYFELPRARPMGSVVDLVALHKDGRELPVDISVNSMRTGEGDFALASILDVSARKRAEAARAALTARLQEANAELSSGLKERETLLQEVHHRVKNNLQIIASLMNMQLRKLDPGVGRAALDECRARVLAIALIHEKLYAARNYARVEFSDYARTLAANIFHATGASHGGVALELAIEDVVLSVERAIPCGLILNELITNALKHAFSGRSGRLRVEFARLDGNLIRLAVRDDGPGLPVHFDIARAKTLGMRLITTLSEQIHARLELENQGGVAFVLTFPSGD